MASIGPGISTADLKARALIRRTALAAFAASGFAGASIRGIAAAAGVSPGLIQYHYRTKEGLKAAVDAFVLEQAVEVMTAVQPLLTEDPSEFTRGLNAALMTFARADPALLSYLRRELLEGGASARVLFDGMLLLTRGIVEHLSAAGLLRADVDPTWGPLLFLVLNLGPILLQPVLDRHLDEPLLSAAGINRWQDANRALGLHGMLTTGS
jgi:AcrR family transcriptional regulator